MPSMSRKSKPKSKRSMPKEVAVPKRSPPKHRASAVERAKACAVLPGSKGVCLPLSNSSRCTIVDKDDCQDLKKYKWHDHGGYACRSVGSGRYAKRHCIHRVLLNAPKGVVVDHIDGDSLNNIRANLRLANKQQNSANVGALAGNKLGIRGVQKRGKKFRAFIHKNGKTIFLGSFPSQGKAACAYDKAAAKHFGEFARLNGAC